MTNKTFGQRRDDIDLVLELLGLLVVILIAVENLDRIQLNRLSMMKYKNSNQDVSNKKVRGELDGPRRSSSRWPRTRLRRRRCRAPCQLYT